MKKGNYDFGDTWKKIHKLKKRSKTIKKKIPSKKSVRATEILH